MPGLSLSAHDDRMPWLESLVATFQSAALGSSKGLETRPLKDLSKAVRCVPCRGGRDAFLLCNPRNLSTRLKPLPRSALGRQSAVVASAWIAARGLCQPEQLLSPALSAFLTKQSETFPVCFATIASWP